MFNEILPTSTTREIWRTLKRACMLILGLKGLTIKGQHRLSFPRMTNEENAFSTCVSHDC